MNFRTLLLIPYFITAMISVASALPLDHYEFTKITDADINTVIRGKSYFYRIQARDSANGIPTSGLQESVRFDCGGVSPCNMSVLAPADSPNGSGRYTPDPTGGLTILVRFSAAPDSLLLTVKNANTPSIFGSIAVTVQRFPSSFSFLTPLTVDAGVPFQVTLTALDSLGNTVTSFRDDVNLYDNIIRTPITAVPGTNCLNGSCTTFFTLNAGDAIAHQNKINALNSVVYTGQGSAASALSGNISVTPDAYNRVILIFPGEVLTPGASPGKNSSGIAQQVAGTPVGTLSQPVKVYAADQYYNPLDGGIPGGLTLSFTSSILGDTVPGATALNSNPLQFVGGEFLFPSVGARVIDTQASTGNSNSSVVNIIPGPIHHYSFTIQPPAGSVLIADDPAGGGTSPAFSIRITAFDAATNVVTSLNGTQTKRLSAVVLPLPGTSSTDIVDTNPATTIPDNSIVFKNGVATINQILITRKLPSVLLRYTDGSGISADSNIWKIQEGSPKQIHLTIKNGSTGQTFTPGTYPGNTGNTPSIVAGTVLTAQARVVDNRWNVVSGAQTDATTVSILPQSAFRYLDVTPALSDFPPNGELTDGDMIQIRFRTANTQYVTAQAGGSFSFATNSDNVAVSPGVYSRMILKGPGEILRGGIFDGTEPDCKTGSVTQQLAAVSFAVTAYAVDGYCNPIIDATYPRIDFTFQDPNKTISPAVPVFMGASSKIFNITLESLTLPQITVFDALFPADPNKRQTISVDVFPGVLDHFLMSTISSPKVAGTQFNITIRAEDQFNNLINQSINVNLTPNTGAGTMDVNSVTLINGLWSGPVTLYAATATARISMSATGQPQATRTSNSFVISPAASGYKKILQLLPGESIASGTSLGKTGTPTSQTVGLVGILRAIACDLYFNPVLTTGKVNFSSNRYAQFGTTPGDFVNIAGHSEYSTTFLLRTAGAHIITATDVNNPGTISPSISGISGLVGTYKKLQIVAPGETSDPGSSSSSGKTGLPTDQKVSSPFNVVINTVDDYWNVVNVNGGDSNLSADITSTLFIPANNNGGASPVVFSNGTVTRQVLIGQEGAMNLTATDSANLTKPSQSVRLNINPGPAYVLTPPTTVVAGQTFAPFTISLEESGVPVNGYNESIFLSAILVSGGVASGGFNPDRSEKEYVMTNGQVTISDLSYANVENIRIKVRDVFGRVGFSNGINVQPSGLKYNIEVASSAVAGPPSTFSVRVTLLDANTDTLVKNHDHTVSVEVRSAVNVTTDGSFTITSANLSQGVATFEQSYSKAESIIVRISEDATSGDPDFVIPAKNSNNVTVTADGYKKLILILPGENYVPGVPSTTGKTGTAFPQQKGLAFLAQVKGVDQYWNTANLTNGGEITWASADAPPSISPTNPSNQGGSLVAGELAAFITLNVPGDVEVNVQDTSNPTIGGQAANVVVQGLYYLVDNLPAEEYAGPPTTFTMNVTLYDSNTNLPVPTANNPITLRAIYSNGNAARGYLGVTNGQLSGGTSGITTQSYSIAEKIRICADDTNGNTGCSAVIKFIPRQVRYTFQTPTNAVVSSSFNVVVQAIDQDTDSNIQNLSRTNTLEAYSTLTGLPVTGVFVPGIVNIVNGVGNVSATYNDVDTIYLVMKDTTPPTGISPPTQTSFTSAGSINITAGTLDSITGFADFSIQSNETKNLTLTALDSLGHVIPNQIITIAVNRINETGQLEINGSAKYPFSGTTNSLGQLPIVIRPSPQTNGSVELILRDGIYPQGFSNLVTVTVLGAAPSSALELNTGENRIPVHSNYFLDITFTGQRGGTVRSYYRVNGGAYTLYDPVNGIGGFDETRQYTIEYYSEVCYDVGCANPISELTLKGAANIALVSTYNIENSISNYPNPFNPKGSSDENFTTIQYPLAQLSNVEIKIYDLFGNKIWHKDISGGEQGGEARPDNRVYWFGVNDDGSTVANGAYIVLVRITATGQTMRTKILVVK